MKVSIDGLDLQSNLEIGRVMSCLQQTVQRNPTAGRDNGIAYTYRDYPATVCVWKTDKQWNVLVKHDGKEGK